MCLGKQRYIEGVFTDRREETSSPCPSSSFESALHSSPPFLMQFDTFCPVLGLKWERCLRCESGRQIARISRLSGHLLDITLLILFYDTSVWGISIFNLRRVLKLNFPSLHLIFPSWVYYNSFPGAVTFWRAKECSLSSVFHFLTVGMSFRFSSRCSCFIVTSYCCFSCFLLDSGWSSSAVQFEHLSFLSPLIKSGRNSLSLANSWGSEIS